VNDPAPQVFCGATLSGPFLAGNPRPVGGELQMRRPRQMSRDCLRHPLPGNRDERTLCTSWNPVPSGGFPPRRIGSRKRCKATRVPIACQSIIAGLAAGRSDAGQWLRGVWHTPVLSAHDRGFVISGLLSADDKADDEIDGGNKDKADKDANGTCHETVPTSRMTP
jgi:hypothetical protein